VLSTAAACEPTHADLTPHPPSQAQLQILTEMGFSQEAAWEVVCLVPGDTSEQVEWLQQNQEKFNPPAAVELPAAPSHHPRAAHTPAPSDGGGGASMLTKLSAYSARLPSLGLGATKEGAAGGGSGGSTADALKAAVKDGSSVRPTPYTISFICCAPRGLPNVGGCVDTLPDPWRWWRWCSGWGASWLARFPRARRYAEQRGYEAHSRPDLCRC
jgi:hypothetical protein